MVKNGNPYPFPKFLNYSKANRVKKYKSFTHVAKAMQNTMQNSYSKNLFKTVERIECLYENLVRSCKEVLPNQTKFNLGHQRLPMHGLLLYISNRFVFKVFYYIVCDYCSF